MEEVILRFPHLAEKLFQELDCKSLIVFRGVKRTWNDLVEDLVSYHFYIIKILIRENSVICTRRVCHVHRVFRYNFQNF